MTKNDVDPSGLYDPEVSGSAPHAAPEDEGATVRTVVYPPAGLSTEYAKALLDAAGEDREHEVVSRDGGFEVPEDIAKGVNFDKLEADSTDGETTTSRRAPAKKAAGSKASS